MRFPFAHFSVSACSLCPFAFSIFKSISRERFFSASISTFFCFSANCECFSRSASSSASIFSAPTPNASARKTASAFRCASFFLASFSLRVRSASATASFSAILRDSSAAPLSRASWVVSCLKRVSFSCALSRSCAAAALTARARWMTTIAESSADVCVAGLRSELLSEAIPLMAEPPACPSSAAASDAFSAKAILSSSCATSSKAALRRFSKAS
mmetsp:Transcript_22043/g.55878  ORF Transcript_22043/g.55878 Transcript_22043/m.55878 type:complete len:215 (+) Transcript_22043:1257-1901(+)